MSDRVTRVAGVALLCCALQASFVVAEPMLNNLTAQEQQEYQQRLQNAESEQQRAAVQAEYQTMSQERSRQRDQQDATTSQSQQTVHGKHKGSAGSPNAELKGVPAGNKNKSQKKGG